MNRKIPVSWALAITIIAMTVTFAITWLLSMSTFDNTVSAVQRLQAQYQKLSEIDNYVRGNFYGEIDDDYLFDRVAVGYMAGLQDRYSIYYSEKEYTEYQSIESGKLSGVGIEVLRDVDGFRIVRVFPDSPAAKAGVTKHGRILAVDGVDASTFTSVSTLQSALRGEDGTDLALNVLYGVTEETLFDIRRSNYTSPTVESQYFGDYCYVRVYGFGSNTYIDFEYAIRQAQNEGVKGFVFDVRGTSGGRFREELYQVIDLLCPRGTVAKSINKTGAVRVLATSDDEAVDVPMVVLVDANTAGPAELFAISLRDLAGAQIAGAKTAGKASIQSTPQRLQDGSAVSVTVAQLLTGNDESFGDGVGILPNVELEAGLINEEMLYDPDPMADAHILRAIEMVRAMVREAGGDPGPAITTLPNQQAGGDSSSPEDSSSSPDDSSLASDDSLAGEDTSLTGDESGTETDSSVSGEESGSTG